MNTDVGPQTYHLVILRKRLLPVISSAFVGVKWRAFLTLGLMNVLVRATTY
jgi:hypothetical protein